MSSASAAASSGGAPSSSLLAVASALLAATDAHGIGGVEAFLAKGDPELLEALDDLAADAPDGA